MFCGQMPLSDSSCTAAGPKNLILGGNAEKILKI
jgi:hypothetical protein